MTDITESFRRYRESARMVWNFCLRDYPDGEVEFVEVDRALFDALVISQLHDHQRDQTKEYYNQIKVRPKFQNALFSFVNPNGMIEWKTGKIDSSDDLRYQGLFDFESSNHIYRDFRYVRAKLLGNTSSERTTDILLDADTVELFDAEH